MTDRKEQCEKRELSAADLIALKVAQLALGAALKELSWTERGSAIWQAFRLGREYAAKDGKDE